MGKTLVLVTTSMSARIFTLLALLLLTACATQANRSSRAPREGGPIWFQTSSAAAGSRTRVRSSVVLEIDAPRRMRGGIEQELDWTVLAGSDPQVTRARLEVRLWNKWSSSGGVEPAPTAGRSYILERFAGALRVSRDAGGLLSSEEQRVLVREYQGFGRPTAHERVLAGRALRPGETVPILDQRNGAVLEGHMRLLGMTWFDNRRVAEFELVGRVSKLDPDRDFSGDVAGVALVDPADTSLVMLDLSGHVQMRSEARTVGGRWKSLTTSTRR